MTKPRLDLRPGMTEPVFVMFSRREVEPADPSASVLRLNALFNTQETIWRYRGQVALVVDGLRAGRFDELLGYWQCWRSTPNRAGMTSNGLPRPWPRVRRGRRAQVD